MAVQKAVRKADMWAIQTAARRAARSAVTRAVSTVQVKVDPTARRLGTQTALEMAASLE
jgi:ribosomal protein S11